ncbi:hypothetical protein [Stomatohabitans albus]|uniref:hypothetical protein n=1 Tax=Stomatohabitans albus TaxID=3110766 RepID=UPI00300C78B0
MKRIVFSFIAGSVVWIVLASLYIAGISIWNSTINTADRTWLFNGKELTSAEMRSVAMELAKDGDARPLASTCHNPEDNPNHYSGTLVDESRGLVHLFASQPNLEEVPETTDRFQDALACNAVLPNSLSPMEYVWFTVSSPFVPVQ